MLRASLVPNAATLALTLTYFDLHYAAAAPIHIYFIYSLCIYSINYPMSALTLLVE